VAVATLWLLSVGGLAEATIPASTLCDIQSPLAEQRRQRRATRLRLVSIFRRGWTTLVVALLQQAPLPMGAFLPEPWPEGPALAVNRVVPELEAHDHGVASKLTPQSLREGGVWTRQCHGRALMVLAYHTLC
jgi:hypothetical protein